MTAPHRLITRSDLDGIVSAALLKELGLVHDVLFAHPKDVQDGVVSIGGNDIIACLPPHPAAKHIFTHRLGDEYRAAAAAGHVICDPQAASTSDVIYRHFGGAQKFAGLWPQLLRAASTINNAELTKQDILTPAGWTLLGFLADSRTGLGRFRNFRISNYQLMMDMVDILREAKSVEDILAHPDVAERVMMYRQHAQPARAQIVRVAQVTGPLVTLDLRTEREIFTTNRFSVYALFPQCCMSMHVLPGRQHQNTVFAVGRSVLNREAAMDVGALMREYGGGGHGAMGACQVPNADAARVKEELIQRIAAEARLAAPAAGGTGGNRATA